MSATEYFIGTDTDQESRRGYYADGLIVVGHVEIPEKSTADVQLQEKPLTERERNNLLRIIAALAKDARIPLEDGKGGAKNIADAIARFPFDGPKVDTIRSVLAQVRKLYGET